VVKEGMRLVYGRVERAIGVIVSGNKMNDWLQYGFAWFGVRQCDVQTCGFFFFFLVGQGAL
jgi:hypothetical protein